MTGVPAISRVSALACICAVSAFPLGQRTIDHAVANEPTAASSVQQGLSTALHQDTETARLEPVASCGGVGECMPRSTDTNPIQDDLTAAPRAPAGQFKIGAQINPQELHIVTRPGLYGIGRPPHGSSFGVISGRLIRFDPNTLRVLSVIRGVDQILD